LSVFTLLLLCCLSGASEINFVKEFYNVSIKENSLPRTYVKGNELMGVKLSSLPEVSHVQYSILSGDPEGFFAVEEKEMGGISLLRIRTKTGLRDVLNRERQSAYTLKISAKARSPSNSLLSATATVQVAVEDTNDNTPLFYPDSYKVDAPEDLLLNARLVQVKAHDADAGRNGEVYFYLSDPLTNWFAVHPVTGVVSLTRPLHDHRMEKFRLIVLARDRGSDGALVREGAIGQADVDISVIAMNNAPPKITVRHLPNVVEHAHAHIYGILTVTDPDDGHSGDIDLVEIIDGDPDRVFSIGRGEKPNEYNLMVLRLLDRELAPAGYNLTIRATDKGRPPASTEKTLSVIIADVNDHAPQFYKEEYDVSVSEEAPPSTPVVKLLAADSDQGRNGEVTFEIIGGNKNRKFWINSATGLISTSDWLDAEAESSYTLTVAAIDGASPAVRKQSTVRVIVRILDTNDNAPTFMDIDDIVEVDENEPAGSFVMRVTASDSDSSENGFLSYSLVNSNQIPFTIDPFDGVIKTAKVLDFENGKKTYTLNVRVSDWGQPYKHETQTVIKVNVRDVNDNRPQFLESDCSGWLSANTHRDRTIVTLRAVDLDADSTVRYHLVGNTDRDCWSIDPEYGIITANCNLRVSILQRARAKTVVLNVTATDGRYISDPVTVTLNVIDPQYSNQENLHFAR
ncbi:Cadherin, partial [Trinorchestia longiramus]